jgi:hypothetical protein
MAKPVVGGLEPRPPHRWLRHYSYVYLLKTKDEALNYLKAYIAEAKNPLEREIK